MNTLTLAALLTLTAGYAAQADEPVPASAPATVSAPAPGPGEDARSAEDKAATDPAAREKIEKDRAAAQANSIKQLRSAGYKPVTRNGETLWCRDEAPLGSRLEKKTCASMDSILGGARNGQEFVDTLQSKGLRPGSLK